MFRKKEPQEKLRRPHLDSETLKSFGFDALAKEYCELAIKIILKYPENNYTEEELKHCMPAHLHQILYKHKILYGEI
ncbi:MAG: hypothetical protein ACOYBH_07960 [Candidatus Alectryocaccobium sp.]